MRLRNSSINTQYVLYLLIILLIIYVGYLLNENNNSKLIDTKLYEKNIDLLNSKIELYDVRIDSIEETIDIYIKKSEQYNLELTELKYKLEKYKKQHEKDITRINAMSSGNLQREFTNTFK